MTSKAPVRLGTLAISPPLLNSASPWCSDLGQLTALYASPSTGAVTTRTATVAGFEQDEAVHSHVFLRSGSSLNTYGYSPHDLSFYLDAVRSILTAHPDCAKPFIISITSSDPEELKDMMLAVQALRLELADGADGKPSRIALEVNTSCPNIPGHPPPSYSPLTSFPYLLGPLLAALPADLTLGLKLPPYTHVGQFAELVRFLEGEQCCPSLLPPCGRCRIAYLACCNTLGGCLGFPMTTVADGDAPAGGKVEEEVDLDRFAGLAGEGLHALALGNVRRFALVLARSPSPAVRAVALIGIGGASTPASVRRFLGAGARAVGLATALGKGGVGAFDDLVEGCL